MTTSTSSTPSALQDIAETDDAYDEDEDLFPETANNHLRTPPDNDHLNATAPGELSPPRSQPPTQIDESNATAGVGGATTNSSVPNGGAQGNAGVGANTSAARTGPTTRSTTIAAAAGNGTAAASRETTLDIPSQLLDDQDQDQRPGWAWKNKKAQEEMQRAWENITDRDFSLKEYGDVVMLGKARMAKT